MAAPRRESIQIDVTLEGKLASKSIKELKEIAKQLNKEIEQLKPGTEEFEKKAQGIRNVNHVIKELKKDIQGVRKEIDEAAESTEGFGEAAEKAGGLFQKAFYFIEVIKQVYEAIAAFVDLGKESTKLQQNFKMMGITTQEEAAALAARVQAMSKAYGKEVDELQATAYTMARTFGTSIQEALDNVETAILNADDDELLDHMKEYGEQIRAIGGSIEDVTNLAVAGASAGAWNMDKVFDTYKEFGLRINEQTKATSDSLEVLGKEWRDNLFKGINDGSIKAIDALDMVVSRANEMGISTKDLQTIIADTFGAPGEDLGWPILTEISKTRKSALQLSDDVKKAQDAQRLYTATLQEALTALGNVASDVKKFFVELILASSPLQDTVKAAWQEIGVLFDELGKLFRALGFVSDRTQTATAIINILKVTFTAAIAPMRLVVNTITMLSEAFRKAYEEGGFLKTTVDGIISFVGKLSKEVAAFVSDIAASLGITINVKKPESAKPAAATKLEQSGGVRKITREAFTPEADRAKAAKEKADRLKNEEDIQRNINQLRIALMEEGYEKEKALLEERARHQIASLKGSKQQVQEQTILINTKLEQDLAALRRKYDEINFLNEQEQIELLKQIRLGDFEDQMRVIEQARKLAMEREKLDFAKQQEELMQTESLTQEERDFRLSQMSDKRRMRELMLERQALEQELQLRMEYDELTYQREHEIQARIAEIRAQYAELNLQQKRAEAAEEMRLLQAKLEMEQTVAAQSSAMFGDMAELAGKQTALGKAMLAFQKSAAIAEVIISSIKEIAMHNASPQNIATGGTYGAIMSAIVKARTAIAVAKIMSTGFAEGGFTGSGFGLPDRSGKRPAGIVHENEYVMPEWMLRTPEGATLAGMAERIRLRGFALGGYTTGATNRSAITASRQPAVGSPAALVPESLPAALLQFAQAISRPLEMRAYVNPFELNDFYADYNDIRNRAGN